MVSQNFVELFPIQFTQSIGKKSDEIIVLHIELFYVYFTIKNSKSIFNEVFLPITYLFIIIKKIILIIKY